MGTPIYWMTSSSLCPWVLPSYRRGKLSLLKGNSSLNSSLDKRIRSIIDKMGLKLVKFFSGLKIIGEVQGKQKCQQRQKKHWNWCSSIKGEETGLMHLVQASGSPEERRFGTYIESSPSYQTSQHDTKTGTTSSSRALVCDLSLELLRNWHGKSFK